MNAWISVRLRNVTCILRENFQIFYYTFAVPLQLRIYNITVIPALRCNYYSNITTYRNDREKRDRRLPLKFKQIFIL